MKTLLYFEAFFPMSGHQSALDLIASASASKDVIAYGNIPSLVRGNKNIRIVQSRDDIMVELVDTDEMICFARAQPVLDGKFLAGLFSNAPKKLCWIDAAGQLQLFKQNPEGEKVLFIFPGSILPLSLGSHQRAFNLLLNLSRHGYAIDVLIPQNKVEERERLAQSLSTVCHRVYFYRNKSKKYKGLAKILRGLDKRWRALQGKNQNLPDMFSERDFMKSTESSKRWVNSLYLANQYPLVIVSYAWMLNTIEYIRHFSDDFNLICDTHDVQFHRNAGFLNRRERLMYNASAEKNLELKRLESTDAVLAISVSDAELLKSELKKTKVITAPAGFDYALERVKKRPQGRPIHFGFIGGGMDANVKALEFIIKNWWPIIKQHSPDSILYIAGSVAKAPQILSLMFFEENIKSLGFVKDLKDFYNVIEVALNPVLVQGGLNFKSVEAVFSGRHLVTNALGIECLGKDFKCTVVEDPRDLIKFMNEIEFDLQYDQNFRLSAQKQAQKMFSNSVVVSDFIQLLKSSAG
jgi:hypothetical protein